MKEVMKLCYFADSYYSGLDIEEKNNWINIFLRPQNSYDPSQKTIATLSVRNNDQRKTFQDECKKNDHDLDNDDDCFEYLYDDMEVRREYEQNILESAKNNWYWDAEFCFKYN